MNNKQPLVFLHGLWGNESNFTPQIKFFSEHFHVLVPNWKDIAAPYYDNSDNDLNTAIEVLIAWLENHCQQKPILCGHSFGGKLALELAVNHKFAVKGIVVIDSSLPISQESKAGYQNLVNDLRSTHAKQAIHDIVTHIYTSTYDDQDLMQTVTEEIVSRHDTIWANIIASALDLDEETWLQNFREPFLFIGSSNTFGNFHEIKRLMPHALISQVVASGHFVPLNAAEQLNAMLTRFLEIIDPSG